MLNVSGFVSEQQAPDNRSSVGLSCAGLCLPPRLQAPAPRWRLPTLGVLGESTLGQPWGHQEEAPFFQITQQAHRALPGLPCSSDAAAAVPLFDLPADAVELVLGYVDDKRALRLVCKRTRASVLGVI